MEQDLCGPIRLARFLRTHSSLLDFGRAENSRLGGGLFTPFAGNSLLDGAALSALR
jgi:hypothetical protein